MESLQNQSTNQETEMVQLMTPHTSSELSNSNGISSLTDKEWEDEDYSQMATPPKMNC